MEKVFLSNGEEVELLSEFQDGKHNYYVVKVVVGENCYPSEFNEECELVYENKIVNNVYKNYKDIPIFLEKTKLEKEVEELENKVRQLNEQKTKMEKEFKSIYNPQFRIGTPIYATLYGNKVEELKIKKIIFTEREDSSSYEYDCGQLNRRFEKIGNEYFLTKDEAEKARREYLKNQELEEFKAIEENYKRAKEKYEKIKELKADKIK